MHKHIWAKGKPNLEEIAYLIRDKLIDSGLVIERKHAKAISLLVILIIAGSITLYAMSRPKPVVVLKDGSRKEGQVSTNTSSKSDSAERIYVHVAGAVAHPGVYQLKEGYRVIDAVEAAGGALESAAVDSINLAAKLFDGQKIYIPHKGESSPQSSGLLSDPSSTDGGDKINLNTATLEQLDSLPGIGQVTAKKIIDYRNKHGFFRSIDDLKAIDGIGSKKFDQIKEMVYVD